MTDTVTEYLMTDHQRLDGLLSGALALAGSGDTGAAAARFSEFAHGLERHIRMEEEILFPAFEKATGMTSGGPTEVMRREHAGIRHLLEVAGAAIHAGEAGPFSRAVLEIRQTLGPHNIKEEQVLYPMSDEVAGDARAREDLVRRMRSIC